jgi:hypothetical protein
MYISGSHCHTEIGSDLWQVTMGLRFTDGRGRSFVTGLSDRTKYTKRFVPKMGC